MATRAKHSSDTTGKGEQRLRESEANRAEAVEQARAAFEEQDAVEGHEGTDSSYPEPRRSDPISHPAGDFADNRREPARHSRLL